MRAGYMLSEVAPMFGAGEWIAGAVQDQGRYADRRKHSARVRVKRAAQERDRRAGTCSKPLVTGPPSPHCRIASLACDQGLESDAMPPTRFYRLQQLLSALGGDSPRVIVIPGDSRIGVQKNKSSCSVRMRRRE